MRYVLQPDGRPSGWVRAPAWNLVVELHDILPGSHLPTHQVVANCSLLMPYQPASAFPFCRARSRCRSRMRLPARWSHCSTIVRVAKGRWSGAPRVVRPACARVARTWRRHLDDGRRRCGPATSDAPPCRAGGGAGPFELPDRHAWPSAAHGALHRAHHIYGGRAEAEAAVARVRGIHDRVRGVCLTALPTPPTTHCCWPGCI